MREIKLNIKLEDLGKVQELISRVQKELEEKDNRIKELEGKKK